MTKNCKTSQTSPMTSLDLTRSSDNQSPNSTESFIEIDKLDSKFEQKMIEQLDNFKQTLEKANRLDRFGILMLNIVFNFNKDSTEAIIIYIMIDF